MVKTNGAIQFVPLLRIVLMLIIGILVGDALQNTVPSVAYFVLLVGLLVLFFIVRKHPLLSGNIIFLAAFAFGAWLFSLKKNDLQRCPTDVPLVYTAVVYDVPTVQGKVLKCNLLVIDTENTSQCEPFKIRASILRDTLTHRWKTLVPGKCIRAQSVLRNDFTFYTHSHFSFQRWMAAHQIKATTFIYCDDWQQAVASERQWAALSVWQQLQLRLLNYRQKLISQTWSGKLNKDKEALLASVTLGEKSKLSQRQRDAYNLAGVSHVLALSGLHLGIIYTLLSLFFSYLIGLFVPREWTHLCAQSIVIPAVWGYVFLVGMPSSAVRAAVMISVYAVVSLLNREKMSVNVLALAAVIMLVYNPMLLWDVGFQLSFVSVLSIFVFYRPIYYFAGINRWGRIPAFLWGLIAVSVAAQIGVFPLVIYYFERFSFYFILSNVIIVPIMTLLLYTALVSLAFWFIPELTRLCLALMDMLLSVMNATVSFFSGGVDHLQINGVQVCLIYLLIGCLYMLTRYVYFLYSPIRYN